MRLLSDTILLLVAGSGSLKQKDCGSGERDRRWKGRSRNVGTRRIMDSAIEIRSETVTQGAHGFYYHYFCLGQELTASNSTLP